MAHMGRPCVLAGLSEKGERRLTLSAEGVVRSGENGEENATHSSKPALAITGRASPVRVQACAAQPPTQPAAGARHRSSTEGWIRKQSGTTL
jgi:hypothetical protein